MKKRRKMSKKDLECDSRRYWNPIYSDFEFYKSNYKNGNSYLIHYIAEKDKVYMVSVDGTIFQSLVCALDLNPNPFVAGTSDNCTARHIWQMIAAYCRTYGNPVTREKAKELAALPNLIIQEDGSRQEGKPMVRMSREDLHKHTDVWLRQYILEQKRKERIDIIPEAERAA